MARMGVSFDGVNTLSVWGLVCTSLKVGMPDIKVKHIELKGSDSYIDLSNVFGRVLYGNRKIEAEFVLHESNADDWARTIEKIGNALHGERKEIILDNDLSYYYVGRISCEFEKTYRAFSIVKIVMDCEPYKYLTDQSGGRWLWSPFNLHTGIIDAGTLEVSGTYTYTLKGLKKKSIPNFQCSNAMTVLYNGLTYNLSEGSNYLLELKPTQDGDNVYIFNGHGTVKVYYKGGAL